MTEGVLTIELSGVRRDLRAGEVVTFGRAGDLLVDDTNPYLHRLVGRFYWRAGCWWVENLGTVVELLLTAAGDAVRLPARTTVGEPKAASIKASAFEVLFESNGISYRLSGQASPDPAAQPEGTPGHAAMTAENAVRGAVQLSGSEQALLDRLAGHRSRDPLLGPGALPATSELAAELGWQPYALDRKLDYLASRLTVAGATGLQRHPGHDEAARRWQLSDHAVNAQLVRPVPLES